MKRYFFTDKPSIAIAIVLGIALVVRLLGILSRPIWYDEAFSILFADKGPIAMLAGTLPTDTSGTAFEEHPLAYYSFLWLWIRLFGQSILAVRLLSILLGIGTVAISYMLIRHMFGQEKLALLASLGVALSPFQIHYSQEIRMYVLMGLALLCATYFLWMGLHTERTKWWIYFTLSITLAQYTHHLSALFILPLASISVWVGNRKKILLTVASGAGALFLYAPWLFNLPSQIAKIQSGYWVARPEIQNVFTTLLSYVTNLPLDGALIPAGLSITLILLTFAGFQTYLALRAKKQDAINGFLLAYLAFAPAVLMYLVSQLTPVYIERALLPSGVMFCLWLVWATFKTDLPRPLQAANILLFLTAFGIGLYMHLAYAGFPYGPYKNMAVALSERIQPQDVIIHSNKLTYLPLYYFDRSLQQTFVADQPGSSSDTLAPTTQAVLGINSSPSIQDAAGNSTRAFLIIFQNEIEEIVNDSQPVHPYISWLDANYTTFTKETWGPIDIYVFSR